MITKAIITNFKGVEKCELDLGNKVTCITGMNGAGKTSLMQAIGFGLAGVAPLNLIRNEKSDLTAKIIFDDKKSIERNLAVAEDGKHSIKTKVNGKAATQTALGKYVEDTTTYTQDIAKSIVSPNFFEMLTPEETGKFFFGNMPICEKLENIIRVGGLTEPEAEQVRKFFGEEERISLTSIDAFYKEVYAERTKANKEWNTLKGKSSYTGTHEELTVADLEAMEQELLRKQNAAATAIALKSDYEKRCAAYESALAKVSELKEQIDSILATEPDTELKNTLTADLKNAMDTIAGIKETCLKLTNDIQHNEELLKKLGSDRCPLCEDLECRTDKMPLIDALTTANNAYAESLTSHQVALKEWTEYLNAVNTDLDACTENEKAWEKRANLLLQFESLSASMPAKPELPEVEEVPDYTAELANLSKRKLYRAMEDEALKSVDGCKKAEEVYNLLDSLCTKFGPKGCIKKAYLALIAETYEEVANDIAFSSAFYDLSFKFQSVDNGLSILVQANAKDGYVPMKSLSSGQKIIATFILTKMVNANGGKNYLLMLDDLNQLDEAAFQTLISVVKADKEYENIILAFTYHQALVDICKKEGVHLVVLGEELTVA